MTIQELYKEGIFRLKQARIAEAELDAWYLLEYVTGISRTMYYLEKSKRRKDILTVSAGGRRGFRFSILLGSRNLWDCHLLSMNMC